MRGAGGDALQLGINAWVICLFCNLKNCSFILNGKNEVFFRYQITIFEKEFSDFILISSR
jgi:hypothetical protein